MKTYPRFLAAYPCDQFPTQLAAGHVSAVLDGVANNALGYTGVFVRSISCDPGYNTTMSTSDYQQVCTPTGQDENAITCTGEHRQPSIVQQTQCGPIFRWRSIC